MDPSDNSYVEALMNAENVPSDKPLVGFSIRRWADSGYLDQIAKIADYCVDKFDAHPLFIPMQYPMDFEISESIRSKMKHDSSIITGTYTPEVILGLTSKLELMVGMRLHSIIYAANRCVPLIGLVYEPKVGAFLNEIGQPSAGYTDKLDYEEICRQLDYIWENREKTKTQLCESKKRLTIMSNANIMTAYDLLKN